MVTKILRNFIELFFPRNCCLCGRTLVDGEQELCMHCLLSLPEAINANGEKNIVERRFIGRMPIEAATALLVFERKSKAQELLHQIKYYGNEQLAIILGQQLGHKIAANPRFESVDVIIPVPLHRRKERKRGYNQSQLICKGITEAFNRPIDTDSLVRTRHTETQTKKNRQQRLENMKGSFNLRDTSTLKDKHVLIVDDVVTTGATIEACWKAMSSVPGIRISVAALSIAGGN